MRAIFKTLPIAAPFDWHTDFFCGLFDGRRDLVIKRPIPTDFPANECTKVDRVAGQVPAFKR